MLQAIELLQLSCGELTEWLEEAARENDALEVTRPEQLPRITRGSAEATERHHQALQNHPAREACLEESLQEQLAMRDLTEEHAAWVRFLIGCLDPSGLLSMSDEECLRLAGEEGLSESAELLGPAIATLQSLEPRGVGGRDAVEAMLLQLDPSEPLYPLLCRLLEDFLDELAKNQRPQIARSLSISLEELEELVGGLRELDPCPGRSQFAEEAEAILPELIVEPSVDGSYEVELESDHLPRVSIDGEYRSMLSEAEGELAGYLRERVRDARSIVDAVEQRQETLLRVSQSVFRRQREFLEEGPKSLKPLRMTEVAEELGLHPSTISRSVAGKHVQSPWGVHPLRWFFQAGGPADDGCALDTVREAVREVFASEDPAAPLSDEEAVTCLRDRGVDAARRTVAKYRKELEIPSSYLRRRFA
jgi:RNA polymerase sigma-54 factor